MCAAELLGAAACEGHKSHLLLAFRAPGRRHYVYGLKELLGTSIFPWP